MNKHNQEIGSEESKLTFTHAERARPGYGKLRDIASKLTMSNLVARMVGRGSRNWRLPLSEVANRSEEEDTSLFTVDVARLGLSRY